LFVIPLLIVTIIVLVWLTFGWLAHMGTNPRNLVQSLRRTNVAAWQDAVTLAELLGNPRHDELKHDSRIASDLADVLRLHIDAASMEEKPIRLRIFLCRALGEFRVAEALPPLLRAVQIERSPAEIDVRIAALEAIAVYASNNDSERLRGDSEVMNVIVAASREPVLSDGTGQARAELRSTAAYTLGIVGGQEALDRLASLLGDAHPNTRFNATTALCRHGDARALPVLLEMLDPGKELSGPGEEGESSEQSKRYLVVKNGISAAVQLAQRNTSAELDDVIAGLLSIANSDLQNFAPSVRRDIHLRAEDALLELKTR
jgi:hypothetical protein